MLSAQQTEHFARFLGKSFRGAELNAVPPGWKSIAHPYRDDEGEQRTCLTERPSRAWADLCACKRRWLLWRGHEQALRPRLDLAAPVIVCLCGSMRRNWPRLFLEVATRETLRGKIVLMPYAVKHDSDLSDGAREDLEDRLDAQHSWKVALADEVLVLDPLGELGRSTEREAALAVMLGKPLRFYHEESVGPLHLDSKASSIEEANEMIHEQQLRIRDGDER